MRFVLRFVSLLLLIAAVGVAVLDTVQSIARSVVDVTTLQAAWTMFSSDSLVTVLSALRSGPAPDVASDAAAWLLIQPLAALSLALALLFWIAGYKRVPPAGRFAA